MKDVSARQQRVSIAAKSVRSRTTTATAIADTPPAVRKKGSLLASPGTSSPPRRSGAEFLSTTEFGSVPDGWREIKMDPAGAKCPDCAKVITKGFDVSGGFGTEDAMRFRSVGEAASVFESRSNEELTPDQGD